MAAHYDFTAGRVLCQGPQTRLNRRSRQRAFREALRSEAPAIELDLAYIDSADSAFVSDVLDLAGQLHEEDRSLRIVRASSEVVCRLRKGGEAKARLLQVA